MTNLLNQFKSIPKGNNYELFYPYLSARLKQRLVKYYSPKICFGEKQRKKKIQISFYSSSISISEVFNIATNYKRELKGQEQIDEPITKS